MSEHPGVSSADRRSAPARRMATVAAGWTLVVAGGAMIFLPGPGLPVILAGLTLLGKEQPWARRAVVRIRDRTMRIWRRPGAHPVSGSGA